MQNGSPPRRLVDCYAFLGVQPNATAEEISAAYRALVADADAARAQRAAQVLAMLTDPRQRAAYDRALAASRAGGSDRPPGPAGQGATERGPARTPPLAAPGAPQHPGASLLPGGAPGSPGHGLAGTAGNRGSSMEPASARPVSPSGPPAAPPPGGTRAAAQSIPHRRAAPPPRPVPGGAGRRLLALLLGAALLIGMAVVALLLGNRAGTGAPPVPSGPAGGVAPAELVAQAVAAPLVDGVQTLDVVVNGERWRYEPNVIAVRQGLPVRFNLTVKGDPG